MNEIIHIAINIISRAALAFSTFSLMIVSVRYYALSDIDDLVLYQLALSVGLSVLSFGLHDIVIRVASESKRNDESQGYILYLIFGIFFLSLLVVSFVVFLVNSGLSQMWVLYGVISGSAYNNIKIVISYFRGIECLPAYTFLLLCCLGGPYVAGMLYTVTVKGCSMNQMMAIMSISFVISYLISTVMAVFSIKRSGKKVGAEKNNALSILSRALPLYKQNLLGLFLFQADTAFVGFFATEGALAVYGIASRIANMFGIVKEGYSLYTLPKFSKFFSENDIEGIKRYSEHVFKYIFVPLFISFVGLMLFSDAVAEILLGTQKQDVGVLLGILLASHLGFIMLGSTDHLLIASYNERTVLKISMISAFFFVIIAPASFFVFGILGMAVVTMMQRNLTYFLGWYYLKKNSGINITPLTRVEILNG